MDSAVHGFKVQELAFVSIDSTLGVQLHLTRLSIQKGEVPCLR